MLALAFNVFILPTLSFVAQLHRLPSDFQKEIRQVALRFARGPKGWIEGKGGHAFFDAATSIGLRTIPRSPETHLEALFWSSGMKFMFSPMNKITDLHSSWTSDDLPMQAATDIIEASPFSQFSKFTSYANTQGLTSQLSQPDKAGIVQQLYKILLPTYCNKGSFATILEQSYRNRWCKPEILGSLTYHKIVPRLLLKLKFLSTQIPPKVLLANVRLHLNGFHTARRYQKSKPCLFCNHPYSADSLEHILKCQKIRTLFHPSWHANFVRRLFLLDGEGPECITHAYVVYGIYCLHNEMRHSDTADEVALHIKWNRVLVELPITSKSKHVLHDIQKYQSIR